MSQVNRPATPDRQSPGGHRTVIEESSSSPLSDPPPSSPPVITEMAVRDSMPPPTQPASALNRKKSREQDKTNANSHENSETAASKSAPQGKNTQSTITSSSQHEMAFLQSQNRTQQMTPPDSTPTVKPTASDTEPTPTQKPRSKASDAKKRKAAEITAEQKAEEPSEEEQSEDGSQASGESDETLPEDRIADFDWRGLQERYHQKVEHFARQEQDLFEEWGILMESFEVWATTGLTHEVGRSFKRLKTQELFVQHEEDQLEKKRQHYIQVVKAFQTVDTLLDAPEWSKQFIPGRRRSSRPQGSSQPKTNPAASSRNCHKTPLIAMENWAASVVDDIAIEAYPLPDFHPGRCVIL